MTFVLVAGVGGATATSFAGPTATSAMKQKQTGTRPAPKPIDPKVRRLSPGFKPYNFFRVYELYSPTARGEFETAEAYRARLAAVPEGKSFAFTCDLIP